METIKITDERLFKRCAYGVRRLAYGRETELNQETLEILLPNILRGEVDIPDKKLFNMIGTWIIKPSFERSYKLCGGKEYAIGHFVNRLIIRELLRNFNRFLFLYKKTPNKTIIWD